MNRFASMGILALVFVAGAGGFAVWFVVRGEVTWPPGSCASMPTGKFEVVFGNNSKGYSTGFICPTPDNMDCNGHRQALGWGLLAVNGEIVVPEDIFAITSPSPGFTENSFEVIGYNSNRTIIRLVQSRGDELIVAQHGGGSMSSTATTSGSKVRCGTEVYELKPEGWYLNGQLAHSFHTDGSEKK